MKRKPVRSAAVSDPGNLRGNNEDRVYCDDERGIYVVIDGVGGEAGGERAAAIAEAELLARLERATGSIEDRIREGIALAGKRIFEHARRNPELTGMACVLTAAVVSNGEAVVGHVGDTRLYKIRGGAIEKVTRDHSPVGAREDAGEISEREAMQHPRRNEIFRDVGSEERAPDERDFVEIHRIGFEEDSALLLCSDGLTDQVPSSTILDAVARHSGDPTRIARELVRRANDAGGKDNVSIVYVEGPAFAAAVPVKRRRWLPLAAALFAGIALGAVAGVAGYRQWLARNPTPRQTLVVSRDGLATIGEALSKARPGDTVEVGAGIYRERLELPEGVHLVARPPGGAVIEPRADAVQPAAALAVERLKSGSVAGFRIAAGGLPIGVLVADSDVELSGLDVEGAAAAGIAVRGGSRALLHSNYIHDNAGAGVLVEDSAAPRILSNIIVRNGRPPETVRAGLEVTGSARPEVEGNFLLNERNVSWATAVDLAQSNMLAAPPRPRRRP